MVKSTKPSAIKAKNKELKLRGLPRKLKVQDKNDNRAHVGFANLTNIVAQQWKNVDPKFKAELEVKAHQDRIRYKNEMRDWEMKQLEADIREIRRI